MKDKIKQSYRTSKSIYDDVLTRGTWWSRLYMNVFWGGCDDNEIARKGWFTPPFETPEQLHSRLESDYDLKEFHLDRSIVYFLAEKK